MSDSSKLEELRQNMEWTMEAIQYIYDNCDENSEFFEMACDARLLFIQAKRGLENLLQQLEQDDLSRQDTPIPRSE